MALKLKGSTSGFVGLDAPDVAGNNTLILPENSGSAFQVFANDITAGVTTFTQVTVSRNGDLTVPGTISIGGTLTYEDVTSVDSVGIVTARGLSIFGNTTGLQVASGISTFQAITGTTGTFTGDVDIADKIVHTGDTNTAIRFPSADTFTVETAGSERLKVNSSGQLLIGTNITGRVIANVTSIQQIEGTGGTSALSITRNDDAANASTARLSFGRSRANSVGGVTAVTTNDILGEIRFSGADGTDLTNHAASIAAVVDGSVSSNTVPGRITFNTASGSDPVERMRIDSSGKIGINETSPLAKLHVKVGDSSASAYAHTALVVEDSDHTFIDIMSGTTGSGGINFGDSDAIQRGVIEYDHNSDFMRFIIAGGERIRIDSAGKVGINRTPTQHPLEVQHASEPTISFWRGSDKGAAVQAQSSGTYLYSYQNAPLRFSVHSGTSFSERVQIGTTGVIHINSVGGGQAVVAFGNPSGNSFQDQNRIGGDTILVADASVSSAISLPRQGVIAVITGFSEASNTDGLYPQPGVSGIAYLDCGPSRNIKIADLGTFGTTLVAKSAYDATVANSDNSKITVMAGSTQGTFHLVNRMGDAHRFQITFL